VGVDSDRMPDIDDEIRRLGGAAKTVELRMAGFSKSQLAAAIRTRRLLRPRKAWYVLPSTPPALAAAVRVGGRATCVTALHHHDVWLTDHIPLVHVAVHRAASRLRAVSNPRERQTAVGDAIVHWADTPRPRLATASRLFEPPVAVLRDVIGCLTGEDLLTTVESALNRGYVSTTEWTVLLAGMSRAEQAFLEQASGLSGSGVETLFVSRIRRLGLQVRQQVQIGPDRVDALIGDRLVVELDGAKFHDPHVDHVRDTRLVIADRHVLRFDYWQVLYDWHTVEQAVLASVIRGDHRW
jgi:very-short-patch-repair endonuclease